jgi:Xaa-Pro aminopeptidase
MVLSHGPDVRYLTGFTGSSGAVALVGGRAVLFTDGRYTAQAKVQTAENDVPKGKRVRVVIDKRSPSVQAVEWLAGLRVTNTAFDVSHTTVAAMDVMRKALPGKLRRSFLVPTEGLVAKIREIKDAGEIAKMRLAAKLGCALFEDMLEFIEPGVPENEIAAKLEFLARMAGADGMSFESIVASAVRSAMPHARPTMAKLPKRGFLTLDFGVVLGGYCSDMTRTVHLGKANQREWDVYHSVLEAQQAAVAAVRPGVTCGEVDEAARSVLRKARLDKAFSHSTGHGVGLEIHEGPRVASKQEQVLQPGMVITIEPGAYLADKFGVRIEDMVLVTAKGQEVLTAASPKAWIEL